MWQEMGTQFKLRCWHNGLSYELTRLSSGESVFVQGDDAAQFEDDKVAIERTQPALDFDAVCQWLWDQCDYGSASSAAA